jgi:hypothetical protein
MKLLTEWSLYSVFERYRYCASFFFTYPLSLSHLSLFQIAAELFALLAAFKETKPGEEVQWKTEDKGTRKATEESAVPVKERRRQRRRRGSGTGRRNGNG